VSHRLEVDFQHGLAVPEVERAADGRLHLTLTHRQERLLVHLSLPSLEALSFELTTALARIRSS
jgi:hypothetical protein